MIFWQRINKSKGCNFVIELEDNKRKFLNIKKRLKAIGDSL